MMIAIDHIAIPVRDVVASAQFLSEILGMESATPFGPQGDMRLFAIAGARARQGGPPTVNGGARRVPGSGGWNKRKNWEWLIRHNPCGCCIRPISDYERLLYVED